MKYLRQTRRKVLRSFLLVLKFLTSVLMSITVNTRLISETNVLGEDENK